ncbi:hypothetical protein [Thalassotalea mangrovi]|uniref:hypothetical protein n=1 Tax=Thalassotalea mangrovi TaxID=2572245 RepID=UPI00145D3EDC|nr:hypothetical protein [Thalassotalea mangrovi]
MQEASANKLSPDSEENQELRNQHRQENVKKRSSKSDERHQVEKDNRCFVLGYN